MAFYGKKASAETLMKTKTAKQCYDEAWENYSEAFETLYSYRPGTPIPLWTLDEIEEEWGNLEVIIENNRQRDAKHS